MLNMYDWNSYLQNAVVSRKIQQLLMAELKGRHVEQKCRVSHNKCYNFRLTVFKVKVIKRHFALNLLIWHFRYWTDGVWQVWRVKKSRRIFLYVTKMTEHPWQYCFSHVCCFNKLAELQGCCVFMHVVCTFFSNWSSHLSDVFILSNITVNSKLFRHVFINTYVHIIMYDISVSSSSSSVRKMVKSLLPSTVVQ